MRKKRFHLAQILCNSNMKAPVLSILRDGFSQLLLPLSSFFFRIEEERNSIKTSPESTQKMADIYSEQNILHMNQFKIQEK